MKVLYYVVISLVYNATIFSQGVVFPSEPVQAPINELWLLIAGGAALAYEELKK